MSAASLTGQAPDGVRVELDGAVLCVRLDRERRRNALDPASAAALRDVLLEAPSTSAVRSIMVTARGRDFCTGADIASGGVQALAMSPIDYRHSVDVYRELFTAYWNVDKPVVSAVNGTVAGIGWMLALLADLVVASSEARWTHAFTRRAMVPHAGDPYFLSRVIPFHRLHEIALLGETVTTPTLHAWGLVNRMVGPDEVEATALELASRLADGPTKTLGMTKRLYRRAMGSGMDAAFEDERNALALVSTTNDRREGSAAFVDRRPANFQGE
jgi:2-(1,2-epoxy-1,2-dihydrophenyl)acetyl-CoA isomerase